MLRLRFQGREMTARPGVLILCTGNSARSQMAEALLRKHQGFGFDVHSAGTEPKDKVHPMAVRAMGEIGIDIASAKPKDVSRFVSDKSIRHLIIVCDNANQSCPRAWAGAFTRQFMPFDDPAAAEGTADQQMEVFRRVRDEIDTAMKTWQPGRA
jgi:arsenate reductase